MNFSELVKEEIQDDCSIPQYFKQRLIERAKKVEVTPIDEYETNENDIRERAKN